jgi:anti-sigma-K factor RskA
VTPAEMDHVEAVESLGAYTLGALPPDQTASLDRHLERCECCRQDLAQLQRAADVLPGTAAPVDPPAKLKDRIMAIVYAEAELLHAAGPAADRPPSRRWSWWRSWSPRPAFAMGSIAAALVVGAIAGAAIVGRDSTGPTGGTRTAQITDPGASRTARAWITVYDGRARLAVRKMPWPARGRVYQVWVQPAGGKPVPAGVLFVVRSGSVEIPGPLRRGERVLVSTEPQGGSPAPTSPPVIVSPPM